MVFDDTELCLMRVAFKNVLGASFTPVRVKQYRRMHPKSGVSVSCFVDADPAGCRATRHSHTGVSIFVNGTPILWYLKRQNTVEASTFGS
jgi:hypothetical protein